MNKIQKITQANKQAIEQIQEQIALKSTIPIAPIKETGIFAEKKETYDKKFKELATVLTTLIIPPPNNSPMWDYILNEYKQGGKLQNTQSFNQYAKTLNSLLNGNKKTIKQSKTVTLSNGATYYVDGLPPELQKEYLRKATQGEREYFLAKKNIKFVNTEAIKKYSNIAAQARSWFNDKNQPSAKKVRKALIWSYDQYGDYKIKAGGESASDNLFSSSFVVTIAHPQTGEDKDVVFIKKYSTNIEDVYITIAEIDELQKLLEPSKAKKERRKQRLRINLAGLLKHYKGVSVIPDKFVNNLNAKLKKDYSETEIRNAIKDFEGMVFRTRYFAIQDDTPEKAKKREDAYKKTELAFQELKEGFGFNTFAKGGKLTIGDNTTAGVIQDETDTQYKINGNWYAKKIVKVAPFMQDDIPRYNGIPIPNQIDPKYIISAFDNAMDWDKVEEYTHKMEQEMLSNNFPPIKGYPIVLDEDDVGETTFITGEAVSKNDIGKTAWKVTDGHLRSFAALNAGLPYINTELEGYTVTEMAKGGQINKKNKFLGQSEEINY